jgi:nicotinate-nucleotide--dimethylbenzimidazole phosphoribosyltransferase
LYVEAALTRAEVEQALAIGQDAASLAVARGAAALGVGEIGIGNTTAAAALVAAFCGIAAEEAVGAGTGVTGAALERKQQVVALALERHQPNPKDPLGTLAALGGLEIAALVGAMLGAARLRVPLVLDGFITHAAALAAVAIEPRARGFLLAAHASTEPGARHALERLGLDALFDWRMRLGEGTGACLALGMLRTAVALERSMATFATAGIVGRAR